VGEKVFQFNHVGVILFVLCFAVMCVGAYFFGTFCSKPGDTGHSGRDIEYGRQMGRSSELLESIDRRLGSVHDGLGRITVYLGQDAGDLRRIAQRLRDIAGEVEKMENDLSGARSDLGDFRRLCDSGFDFELR